MPLCTSVSCSLLFLKVLGGQILLNLAGLYWDITLLAVLSNFLNSSAKTILMHLIGNLVYLISCHLSQCVGTVSFACITLLVCENQVETQHVFLYQHRAGQSNQFPFINERINECSSLADACLSQWWIIEQMYEEQASEHVT